MRSREVCWSTSEDNHDRDSFLRRKLQKLHNRQTDRLLLSVADGLKRSGMLTIQAIYQDIANALIELYVSSECA